MKLVKLELKNTQERLSSLSMKKRILASFTVIGLLGVGGVSATFAEFSKDVTATSTTLQAANVEINLENGDQISKDLVNIDLGNEKLVPGSSVNSTITVRNTGDLPVNLSIKGIILQQDTTNPLTNLFLLDLKENNTSIRVPTTVPGWTVTAINLNPGEAKVYEIRLDWRVNSSSNGYIGKKFTPGLEFTAVNK
jgi:hypothetical protein